MDTFLYPSFEVVEGRGIIPRIYLPGNYTELVERFYQSGAREELNEYAHGIEKLLESGGELLDIRLNWNNVHGLTNISVGTQSGLDLNTDGIPHFQEHNLGWLNSFIAGAIAMKYLSELLKAE